MLVGGLGPGDGEEEGMGSEMWRGGEGKWERVCMWSRKIQTGENAHFIIFPNSRAKFLLDVAYAFCRKEMSARPLELDSLDLLRR